MGYIRDEREGVSLSIEHPMIQRQYIIITEQQPQVLECFGYKECLLHVIFSWVGVVHILDARVATCVYATVLLQSLHVYNISRITSSSPNENFSLSSVYHGFYTLPTDSLAIAMHW